MKKILVISDLHCGHLAGLTPPQYQLRPNEAADDWALKREKFTEVQRACWAWYVGKVKAMGPFDIVICNGDAIDGPGERAGGSEAVTTVCLHQCEIAEACIKESLGAKTKLVMTAGTAYHTGKCDDFESVIARQLGAEKFGSHEWLDVEGVIFDCKHHIGSSVIPHGRHTAPARDRFWNVLWAEREQQPRSQVFIRSHVHYFTVQGGMDWIGFTTPALQGYGTKYGSRRCSGTVDVGLMTFDVEKGKFSWRVHSMNSPVLSASATKL